MKRIITITIGLVLMYALVGCSNNLGSSTLTNTPTTQETSPTISSTDNPTTTDSKEDDLYMNKTIEFKIGNTVVDVNWLDNDSVKSLKEISKED